MNQFLSVAGGRRGQADATLELVDGIPTPKSIVQCPKVFDDAEQFCLIDINKNLKSVHHMPLNAFRAAVMSLKEPTPFLRLVDWLLDIGDS